MKGPYQRLKYDLRRLWECPGCRHHVRTSGSVTSLICDCQLERPFADRVSMRLIREGETAPPLSQSGH